jgi:hypothetical protein
MEANDGHCECVMLKMKVKREAKPKREVRWWLVCAPGETRSDSSLDGGGVCWSVQHGLELKASSRKVNGATSSSIY